MFRNNYDNDSVTFSPQGRIFQVEYASEAVKQGSVVVGIVSKTHAVLAAIKVGHQESIVHWTRRTVLLQSRQQRHSHGHSEMPKNSRLTRRRSFP